MKRLMLERKKKLPTPRFRKLVKAAEELISKNPNKDTQWIAQKLVEFSKAHGLTPHVHQIKRYQVEDEWVVALRYCGVGLPHVIISRGETEGEVAA